MMDKGSYESYEYLTENENEANQFFVVQDDGTFLSLNRQVHYVAQVQDVKEVVNNVEPCTIYDVSSPPFLIDVNNSELISVPDQLMLPDGENIIFANNYLLPVPNSNEQQIEQQDEADQYEEPEIHVKAEADSEIQKTMDNCTEITLSDDQYHILEQKGWILLETNEKVYVLDTLGLHDITSNNKLIQKLKSAEGTNECIEEECITSLSNQQDNIHLVIEEDGIKLSEEIIGDNDSLLTLVQHDESIEISSQDTTNQILNTTKLEVAAPQYRADISQCNTAENVADKSEHVENELEEEVDSHNIENAHSKFTSSSSMFKVSTDISFKDIPDKIALGETRNGKMLIAKITKLNVNLPRRTSTTAPRTYLKRTQRKTTDCNDENIEEKKLNNTSVDERLFETLIAQATQNGVDVKCSEQDISSAHSTVSQLLKIPEFKASVFARNLIITKVVSIQDEKGGFSCGGQPSLVTGRVKMMDSGCYCFSHVPDMLERLMNNLDYKPQLKKGDIQADVNLEDKNVLHVHVNEVKRADNVLRVSITLNKRKLPTILTNEDCKRKLPGMVLACSTCAALFRTEDELKQHQQTQCLDIDVDLTIDIDKKVVGYTTVKNGKDKTYSCNQCQSKFVKLYNCLKHLKTHYNSTNKVNDAKDGSESVEIQGEQIEGIHKCKMCPSTYHHQSTLAKHIVSKHIKV